MKWIKTSEQLPTDEQLKGIPIEIHGTRCQTIPLFLCKYLGDSSDSSKFTDVDVVMNCYREEEEEDEDNEDDDEVFIDGKWVNREYDEEENEEDKIVRKDGDTRVLEWKGNHNSLSDCYWEEPDYWAEIPLIPGIDGFE